MLKNSGPKFRKHLLIFLNKIIENGQVPEAMNKGKCMLLSKVSRYKKDTKN